MARAFLEIQGTLTPDRTRGIIGAANGFSREIKVRSGEQYQVPVFMALEEMCHLWIDTQRAVYGRVHAAHLTDEGNYLTNESFFNNLNLRQPLPAGSYNIQVVLRLEGHDDEFTTGFRTFRVA